MSRAWMCLVPLMAFAAIGCNNAVHDENQALRRQAIELQERNRQLEADLNARPGTGDVTALQGQIEERNKMIADLQAQLNKPAPDAPPAPSGLDGVTVTRDDSRGTITVNVPGDVLFASGDAAVKNTAKGTLNKIAGILQKDFAKNKIFVNGHTDTDPIVKTKDKWKDNLDLSAERARSVADYLISQGVDKSRITPRAFGASEPKGSKDKSRRVEIVVVTK